MYLKARTLFIIFFLFTAAPIFAQDGSYISSTVIGNGISMGCALAITISWSRNKSVAMAIIHGILSWVYVIYYCLTKLNN